MTLHVIALRPQMPTFYFPAFYGINVMVNEAIGCCAVGGKTYQFVDSVEGLYATTWMPPWAFNEQAVLAHEMGHGFRWPISGTVWTSLMTMFGT